MAQITVSVNNRTYSIACDDGEEEHLRDLARYVDAQVMELVRNVGQISESRLLLMGALLIADQLAEADERAAELKAQLDAVTSARPPAAASAPADLQAVRGNGAADLVRVIETATRRIEALAARLERT